MLKNKFILFLSLVVPAVAFSANSVPAFLIRPTFTSIIRKIYNRQTLDVREWDNVFGYIIGGSTGMLASYSFCQAALQERKGLPLALGLSALVTIGSAKACALFSDAITD